VSDCGCDYTGVARCRCSARFDDRCDYCDWLWDHDCFFEHDCPNVEGENEDDEQMRKQPVEQAEKNPLLESILFVVDMMNNGNVNPEDVYPRGRYQGD
jgi:hypothetical protein